MNIVTMYRDDNNTNARVTRTHALFAELLLNNSNEIVFG